MSIQCGSRWAMEGRRRERRRPRHCLHVLGAVMLFSIGVSTALAQKSGVVVNVRADDEVASMNHPLNAGQALTFVRTGSPPDSAYVLSIAQAYARQGRLQIVAYRNNEGFDNNEATARARFVDTVVIQAPVPPFTDGYFIARIRVDGTLQAAGYALGPGPDPVSGGGLAAYFARFEAESSLGSFIRTLSGSRHSSGTFEGSESGFIERRVEFTFGQPFEISLTLFGEAVTSSGGSFTGAGFARTLYGNSAAWTGLNEVFLLDNDHPVTEFTVSSASGTDYRIDFGRDPLFRHGFDY